jgi:hypothetical protein
MMLSELSITRVEQFVNRYLPYVVWVDGSVSRIVKCGETITMPLDEGPHRIQVLAGRMSSDVICIDVTAGRRVTVECGSHIKGCLIALSLIWLLFPRMWVYVREVQHDDSEKQSVNK